MDKEDVADIHNGTLPFATTQMGPESVVLREVP